MKTVAHNRLLNQRTIVTPVGNGARAQHLKPLSDLDHLWMQRVRAIHNPIGNWLHAMMTMKGMSRAEALEALDAVVAEIREV